MFGDVRSTIPIIIAGSGDVKSACVYESLAHSETRIASLVRARAGKKMIDNTIHPLITFTGSGVAGFFMGMFLRRVLKFLVIIIGSFLGAVFLVIQWMQARQYIQGQVDWSRVGNDTMTWFQSLSAQVSSSHIFGTLGIPATSGLAIGLVAGLAKS
jgi:uncharacterized membrane protein (Fun14 family)